MVQCRCRVQLLWLTSAATSFLVIYYSLLLDELISIDNSVKGFL